MEATVAFPFEALREHVRDLDPADVLAVQAGWDSAVYLAGDWVFRVPRRPEVARRLESEAALLAALGPALPVAIPFFEIVLHGEPGAVGYRRIEGEPLGQRASAVDVGRFLAALHRFPVERARAAGVPDGDWRAGLEDLLAAFRRRVTPRLEPAEQAVADAAFARYLGDEASFDFREALVHADLGPEHLLCRPDGTLAGVIDWTDARIGDPALDFAWLLHGTGPAFAAALVDAYGEPVDAAFRARAGFYHLLGPWHEVLYGLETGDDAYVASGLAGVRARLPAP